MIRVIGNTEEPVQESVLSWREMTDPDEIDEARKAQEAFDRNADWLQSHWQELLPGAYGKYLAVAGQQAFLADSGEESLMLAKAAYPHDRGVFMQYVIPTGTVTIYGIRG